MNLPTPDEFAKEGGHNPFPPRWERWLSSVRQAILTSQPTAGRHVTCDEHPGKGTVINVADTSARRRSSPAGGCPTPGTDCAAEISGITFPCGCIDLGPFGFPGNSIQTEDSAVNTTTSAGFNSGPPAFWVASPLSPFIVHSFSDDHCETPFFSGSVNQQLFFACVEGNITVMLWDTLDLYATFYATGGGVGTPISNILTCGGIVTSPFPPAFGGPSAVLGVAIGGTVLITQP